MVRICGAKLGFEDYCCLDKGHPCLHDPNPCSICGTTGTCKRCINEESIGARLDREERERGATSPQEKTVTKLTNKIPVHSVGYIPENPEQMQHRRVVSPSAFRCPMCNSWMPRGRNAIAYWSQKGGWHTLTCSHHIVNERNYFWPPSHDLSPGQESENKDELTRKEYMGFIASCLQVYAGNGTVYNEQPLKQVLRELWLSIHAYGGLSVMSKLHAMRGRYQEDCDAALCKDPGFVLLISKAADLCGLEITPKAKKRVQKALIDAKLITADLP